MHILSCVSMIFIKKYLPRVLMCLLLDDCRSVPIEWLHSLSQNAVCLFSLHLKHMGSYVCMMVWVYCTVGDVCNTAMEIDF